MKNKWIVVSAIIACTLWLAGCSSAPTAEIDATKAALTGAQTDDVRTYAPEALKAAEDQMSKALAEVQSQDGKFALSRDYAQASAALKAAKDQAEKARSEAEANKIRAKADAEGAMAEIPRLMDEAKAALAKAPKGKDTKADLEAMQNDLKAAEEAVTEAGTALSQEKYNEALAKVSAAREKASAIVDQVKKAQEKIKGRRG